MRTIVLHDNLPEEFVEGMHKISTWGMPSYTKVDVYRDGKEKDMVAVFTTEEGSRFVLGCIWDGNKYSYHS